MLLDKLSSSLEGSNASKEALGYLKEAREVVNSHDKYLEDMSSEGPDIIKPMIQATLDADWQKLLADGKTQSVLVSCCLLCANLLRRYPVHAEMCSGMYEPALLEMLLSVCGVRLLFCLFAARLPVYKGTRCLEIGMFTGTFVSLLLSSTSH